ncbi:hypothetical protein DdX_20404 [Ditylenchus destructor]|uniref:Uncharacterized protein n=1 Tax=Ditylenchus destructor TaxID=166010 RepID=A0AAD4MH87_9BILA|nr:hypothetical protein DdX_20404 [Ditylenchus destructor]
MNKTVVETIMGEMDASAAEISNTAEPQTKSPKDKSPKSKDGKPEKPKKAVKRRSSMHNNENPKRMANKNHSEKLIEDVNAELQQFNEEKQATNIEIININKKMQLAHETAVSELRQELLNYKAANRNEMNEVQKKVENLGRDNNKYTIRVDGVPASDKTEASKMFESIAKKCLLIKDFNQSDLKEVKYLPQLNGKKTIIATFQKMEKKQQFLSMCKHLQHNKLKIGATLHQISVSSMLTQKQIQEKQAALCTKRACEEFNKSTPGFLLDNKMRLVGYNYLDDDPQKKGAKHFKVWLQKLEQAPTETCKTDDFVTVFKKAKLLSKKVN